MKFSCPVSGGYRNSTSVLKVEFDAEELTLTADEPPPDSGEPLLVRLADGHSHTVTVLPPDAEHPITGDLTILAICPAADDLSNAPFVREAEELMRDLVLVEGLGKESIPGYRLRTWLRGQRVPHRGSPSMHVTFDHSYHGTRLNAYVVNVQNLLDVPQTIGFTEFNGAPVLSIRVQREKLAPWPHTLEQTLAGNFLNAALDLPAPCPPEPRMW